MDVAAPKIVAQLRPVRRIVTGHDAEGTAIFLQDDIARQVLALGVPSHGVTELWRTAGVPADNDDPTDPCLGQITLAPPTHGTVFRIVEFPPDEALAKVDHATAFAAMGKNAVETLSGNSGVIMHKTASIDYALVLEGEIWAVLDKSETCLRRGDVLIQRGTNHGWSNRTNSPALLAFVMVGAKPLAD
ncbi:cupin domain-containing protein [Bradyrhizobium embrapense]